MDPEATVEHLRKKGDPRLVLFIPLILLVPLLISLLGALADHVYFYEPLLTGGPLQDADLEQTEGVAPADQDRLRVVQSEIGQLRRKLRSLRPRGIYIVIDTGRSRLYVKRGEQVLLEAVCSTGSGMLLRDPDEERQWIFDTPRGVFHVHQKVVDPVWKKPDWAFVEEGQPVPDKWSERIDREALGKYALHFGDGFMIHGTLYQRYLGRNITHGCVRLGDEDLERVYEMTPVGSPIYIF